MTNVTYTNTINATREAVRADATTTNKWKSCGSYVAQFYGTAEQLRAGKKQFVADAIIPALDKQYQAFLAINVKDTDKDSEAGKLARKNSATARGIVSVYFNRVESYAFPKAPAEPTTREASLAFVEDLIKVAKKGQKLEAAPYNLLKVMGFLNSALKEIGVSATEANEADEM
jgi:hypothetical protein